MSPPEHNFKRTMGTNSFSKNFPKFDSDEHEYFFAAETSAASAGAGKRQRLRSTIPARRNDDANQSGGSSLDKAKQRQARSGAADRSFAEPQTRPKHGSKPPPPMDRSSFQMNARRRTSPYSKDNLQPSSSSRSQASRRNQESPTENSVIDLVESGDETEAEADAVAGNNRTSPRKRKGSYEDSGAGWPAEEMAQMAAAVPKKLRNSRETNGVLRESRATSLTNSLESSHLVPAGISKARARTNNSTVDLTDDEVEVVDNMGPVPRKTKGRTKYDPRSNPVEPMTIPKLKSHCTLKTSSTQLRSVADSLHNSDSDSSPLKMKSDGSKELMSKVRNVESAPALFPKSFDSIVQPALSKFANGGQSGGPDKRIVDPTQFSLRKMNQPFKSKLGNGISSLLESVGSAGTSLKKRLISSPLLSKTTKETKRPGNPIRAGVSIDLSSSTSTPKAKGNERTSYDSNEWRPSPPRRQASRWSPRNSDAAPQPRVTRSRKKKSQETIEILSSDDESEADNPIITSVEFVRFMENGKLGSDRKCCLSFNAESKTFTVGFSKGRRKPQMRTITEEDLLGCHFFLLSEHKDGGKDESNVDRIARMKELDINAIMLLSVNSAILCPNNMKSPRKDVEKDAGRILIQFEEEQDLDDLSASILDSQLRLEPAQLDEFEATDIDYLIKEAETVRMSRTSITPSRKKNEFSSGRAEEEILLVHPFTEEESKIEEAAAGLAIFSSKSDTQEEKIEKSENHAEGRQRSHYVTIRIEDYNRLESEVWLNDSLVDFFMMWISRDIRNIHASDVHFFTSHFYSTLTKEGAGGVASWTAKKDIDIFKKKMIFIPINKSWHWSLCVVINPGEIMDYDPGDSKSSGMKMPCLICLDSLRMHCAHRTRKIITDWLNSEWNRLRLRKGTVPRKATGPFNHTSFRVFTPEVPLQDNGSDCGVFVCRYAMGLYKLRNLDFNEWEIFGDKPPEQYMEQKKMAFSEIITNGADFKFGVQDIEALRRQFQVLIERLSKVYMQWQRGQKSKRKDAETERSEENISQEGNTKEQAVCCARSDAPEMRLDSSRSPSIYEAEDLGTPDQPTPWQVKWDASLAGFSSSAEDKKRGTEQHPEKHVDSPFAGDAPDSFTQLTLPPEAAKVKPPQAKASSFEKGIEEGSYQTRASAGLHQHEDPYDSSGLSVKCCPYPSSQPETTLA